MRPALTCFVFVLLPLACGGPAVTDLATSEVAVTLSAVASAPELAARGESQGGLGVSRVFVSGSAFSLVPCDEGAAAITLEPRAYDLLDDPPPREVVGTAVTELCGLRLDVDPVAENELEGIAEGVSLYVEGKDGDGADFALSSETSLSLLFDTAVGHSFGEVPVLLGLDVSVWLADVPLTPELTSMASEQLVERLPGALALYVDANENQLLDDDESIPFATIAPAH